MRLDGLGLKVSLDRDQVVAAVQALDLADGALWKVYFVEDVTSGLCSATRMLDQHQIVRAREKTKGKDDVTVKFRPAPVAVRRLVAGHDDDRRQQPQISSSKSRKTRPEGGCRRSRY